jgi:hypothetical protein
MAKNQPNRMRPEDLQRKQERIDRDATPLTDANAGVQQRGRDEQGHGKRGTAFGTEDADIRRSSR